MSGFLDTARNFLGGIAGSAMDGITDMIDGVPQIAAQLQLGDTAEGGLAAYERAYLETLDLSADHIEAISDIKIRATQLTADNPALAGIQPGMRAFAVDPENYNEVMALDGLMQDEALSASLAAAIQAGQNGDANPVADRINHILINDPDSLPGVIEEFRADPSPTGLEQALNNRVSSEQAAAAALTATELAQQGGFMEMMQGFLGDMNLDGMMSMLGGMLEAIMPMIASLVESLTGFLQSNDLMVVSNDGGQQTAALAADGTRIENGAPGADDAPEAGTRVGPTIENAQLLADQTPDAAPARVMTPGVN